MTTGSSPLSWGHQAIDAVFRRLPDFSAVFIEAGSQENFAILRTLLERNVLHSAERASLKTQLIVGPHEAEIADDTDIVIVVHSKLSEENRKTLASIDAALICLIETSEKPVSSAGVGEPFDLQINFSGDKVHCLVKGEKSFVTFDCRLKEEAQSEGVQPESHVLMAHGFSAAEISYLRSFMPQVQFVPVTAQDKASGIYRGTIVAGPYPDPKVEEILATVAKERSILFVPKRDLRTEDRLKLFRSGVLSLLPANPEREEVLAALVAMMSETKDSTNRQSIHPDDLAFAEMQRFMRKNLYFEFDQEDELIRTFHAPIANRIARSKSGGQVCSALILRLGQKIPENIRHRLTVLVSGIVRQNDVVFSCGQAICVISSNLNKITARAILKRLRLSADPEWLKAGQTALISAKGDGTHADDEIGGFLRSIIAGCRPT